MPFTGVKFASLDEEQLAEVKALEDEFAVGLLALQPATLKLAELTPEQIEKLGAVEQKLGVMLVAYTE